MKKDNIVIALAGNPNSGKTTIFNALTGSRQRVGNWPGVTVERKEGKTDLDGRQVTVVDLPGIYSLTANSLDERVARDFIVQDKPCLIAVVLDASNLERNLYLSLQLMELKAAPLVLVFNMIDEVEEKGMSIDLDGLSRLLGIPIVATAAKKNRGIQQLKKVLAERIGLDALTPADIPFRYRENTEFAIERLSSRLEKDPVLGQSSPSRWLAVKLLEDDREYLARLEKSPLRNALLEDLGVLKKELEKSIGYDLETALVEERYGFINGIVKEFVKTSWGLEDRLSLSDKIDKVLANRVLGLPIFFFLLWLIFKLTFDVGGFFVDHIDRLFTALGSQAATLIDRLDAPSWVASLVEDGIIGGVGSVLVFVPIIFFLYLAISLLEESGYMARGAFVMDKVMHAMGLHGKSFIPMVVGFGCNVPGIMAARTLENPKDRIITILITPLMSCAARLPIYVLFAGAFFAKHQGTVIFAIYLLGIALAMLMARLFKSIFFKGEPAPLIMELPPYRLPSAKSLLLSAWHRSFIFIQKAGTVIFLAVVAVWCLASLPLGVAYASQESIVGRIGSLFAPLLEPVGFGFWQAAVALVFGILAKEIVVGTLGTLYGAGEETLSGAIAAQFTPVSALAFMVLSLVYIPCIATIGAVRKETNSWFWALFTVAYTLVLGWLLAFLIFQGGKLVYP
ncbi:MAG: ferrous iron transport protein B [Deltaproteobacteria bacterium]|nr:ferrous iron transport protein B [Deltaproteobacteria bacterium]